MRKAVFFIVPIGLFALYSCKVDQICASYQSYYLLSPTLQPSAFSLQEADSVPNLVMPELFALVSEDGLPRKDLPNTEKNKNGLVKSEWALIKNYQMRRVPKEVILPEVNDSLLFKGDDIMFAERDVVDTLALDSARNAAYNYKYNNDQKFYNWYFRDKLVWQDELNQKNEANLDEQDKEKVETTITTKPAKKKFFEGLFKKKTKKESQIPLDSIN